MTIHNSGEKCTPLTLGLDASTAAKVSGRGQHASVCRKLQIRAPNVLERAGAVECQCVQLRIVPL